MNPIWSELTDMTMLEHIASEMIKKYKDTLLMCVRQDGRKELLRFNTCTENGELYNFTLVDTGKTFNLSYDDMSFTLEIPRLQPGCYNSKVSKGAIVVKALPNRQWKRGMCRGNTVAHKLNRFVVGMSDDNNYFNEYVPEMLASEAYKLKYQLDDAIKDMYDLKYISFALNPQFAICLNFASKDENTLFLFYHEYIVGKVYVKEKTIVIENEIFIQEVLDSKATWCPNYRIR